MEIIANDSVVPVWPLALFVLALLLILLWRRQRSLSYLFCAAIFGIYLLLALDRTFFPIRTFEGYVGSRLTINLIPFNFDFSDISAQVPLQIFENVLLTVPFGFGLNFVAYLRAKRVVWLALAVGLGIEAGQLVISLLLGYPYRVIDVNDVLLNALGVLIGYGIFRVFAWMYVSVMRRVGIGRRGLAGYVYEVTSRA